MRLGDRSLLARVLTLAGVGLAAEQVGGAQRCLDLAVDYAKVRTQFGKAIGSFQAIQHACADMFLLVETARSAAYHAGWAAADEPAELAASAATARVYCAEAFAQCAAQCIQIHGGIGFTWEHDAHFYFKRARAGLTLLGTPAQQRAELAVLIGLDDAIGEGA
jgi:alkylation response protein AidB-like acyl-CoA dehydrogenase